MKYKTLLFALFLFFTNTANAYFYSGVHISQMVLAHDRYELGNASDQDISEALILEGYISAVFDENVGTYVCPTPKISSLQVVAVVKKYIKAAPELWNHPGKNLVMFALMMNYPCKK